VALTNPIPATPIFPTPLHQQAAEVIVDFFRTRSPTEAVLVLNSCARGTATPESDLDMAVLVAPTLPAAERRALEQQWVDFYASHDTLRRLKQLGRFTAVHLDVVDGQFEPYTWDDGGGPDTFEIGIGNLAAYSAPMWERNAAFTDLRARWLPYYDAALQQQRLAMVRAACHYDLDFVPFYTGRGLYFQAFDRLYKAFQEFLQALFIAHRTYPIAYNKWIREQVETRLGLPELYVQLPHILEVSQLESDAVVHNAEHLRALLEHWTNG
jgi:predicted nucleotidyltransferase